MATLTLTIANPIANRIMNAVCSANGYQETINGSPNPMSKSDFVKNWLITKLKAEVRQYESTAASNQAGSAAEIDVENNIIIT